MPPPEGHGSSARRSPVALGQRLDEVVHLDEHLGRRVRLERLDMREAPAYRAEWKTRFRSRVEIAELVADDQRFRPRRPAGLQNLAKPARFPERRDPACVVLDQLGSLRPQRTADRGIGVRGNNRERYALL